MIIGIAIFTIIMHIIAYITYYIFYFFTDLKLFEKTNKYLVSVK